MPATVDPSGRLAKVFVITGPSGVGKGTLIRALREQVPEIELSVSATTRAPRGGEEDAVDYHFLDGDDFVMYLGDNLLTSGIVDFVEQFRTGSSAAQAMPAAAARPNARR